MTETAFRTATQVRKEFIDFFRDRHGHTVVPSSPVVPHDDPTLLFTNAGMNQFKDVFLGTGRRPYRRAVDTQKCIRAGGKHNDLEDVGKDTYHHTFFEMLGNWSFGDYFKAEAIEWAWDLLVNHWGLDPDRLYATVFAGDESEGTEPDVEAEQLWARFLPAERISRWAKKDNFWEMGDTGPCGPCSEIHYDDRPDELRQSLPGSELVNRDDPNVIEIWNLVFIQFSRGANGILTPLPARHVDTGMGFERVVRVLQGKESNYDTDLWSPIFESIHDLTGARRYSGEHGDPFDIAYRVLADHARCLTIAIHDGAVPSNEGRGYVLRRILRRGVRVARQTLGVKEPLLCRLVPSVVDTLADAFPELTQQPDKIAGMIRDEELSFLRTLDRGLVLFSEAAVRSLLTAPMKSERWSVETTYKQRDFHVTIKQADGSMLTEDAMNSITPIWVSEYFAMTPRISSDDAFKLHDTYGFPIDLTRIMAEERGLAVDEAGYEQRMEEARRLSRAGTDVLDRVLLPAEAVTQLQQQGVEPTDDIDKYHGRAVIARVRAIWNGQRFADRVIPGEDVGLVLNRTNHYAEQGGQVGDRGVVIADHDGDTVAGAFDVIDTQATGDFVLHVGQVTHGAIRVGDRVTIKLENRHRLPVRANHTTTHLLNLALREVVGDEVEQRGSLVADDRLRFDFVCSRALTTGELERAESIVNREIGAALPVYSDIVPLDQARLINGVRAVFGERYPDPVRVVSIGKPVNDLLGQPDHPDWRDYSVEFCGGTHLETTDQARRFVITQEGALAAGVRRITAITGESAVEADIAGRDLESRVLDAERLLDRELPAALERLAREVDELSISAVARQRVQALLDPLRDRMKSIRKRALESARDSAVAQARELAEREDGDALVFCIIGADKETLRSAMDAIRGRRTESAVMLFAGDEIEGKVSIIASVPQGLIARGLKAGDWVREAAQLCGGAGGGRPDSAQAGGKDPSRITAAIEHAKSFAQEALG